MHAFSMSLFLRNPGLLPEKTRTVDFEWTLVVCFAVSVCSLSFTFKLSCLSRRSAGRCPSLARVYTVLRGGVRVLDSVVRIIITSTTKVSSALIDDGSSSREQHAIRSRLELGGKGDKSNLSM